MEVVLATIVYALASESEKPNLYMSLANQGYPKWIFRIVKKRNTNNFEHIGTVPKEEIPKLIEKVTRILNKIGPNPELYASKLNNVACSAVRRGSSSIFVQAIADVFNLQNEIICYSELVQLNQKHPNYREKYEYFKNFAEKYKNDLLNFVNEVLKNFDIEEMLYAYMLSASSVSTRYIPLSYSILLATRAKTVFDFMKKAENPNTTENDFRTAIEFVGKTHKQIKKDFEELVINDLE